MIYEEVVSEIENSRRFGKRAGVEITAGMLQQLSHPEAGIPMIHIAGTNGKGSVSAFLCEILKQAGLRVGCFTSPHLVDFRERIRINGEMIPKDDVTRLGEKLLHTEFFVTDENGEKERTYPTMFDMCLAMALLYYKEQAVDVMILETGLGGRLDSTNAVGTPEVSVITKIGYDHMAILGNTLPEIAAEKAGIIKSGTDLVVESQACGIAEIFADKAKEVGAASCHIIDPLELQKCHYKAGCQHFDFGAYKDLKMQMLGTHQYENAAAAILAAEAFLKRWMGKKENSAESEADIAHAVRLGIYETRWKGRMEILHQKPFLLVDGAHNSNGVEALRNSLMDLFPGEKFHFVMGVMADKDYEQMVDLLLPLALDFATVTVESERALQAEDLAGYIRTCGVPAKRIEDLEAFLGDYFSMQDRKEKTIAFGSLYFIGEILAKCDRKVTDC